MRTRFLGLVVIFWSVCVIAAPYIPAEWSRYRRSVLLDYTFVRFLLTIFGLLLMTAGFRIFTGDRKK